MKKAVLIILCMFVLVSCATGHYDLNQSYTSDGIPYSIIYIEGMPCVVVENQTAYAYYIYSITCDWSKWDGK